ncbi:MAG: hypothetical protein K2X03_09865 [Bryobacteraceae bacterium]|nr:hypothetical protein [Bryobacteraceae bacterium]
MMRLFTLGLAFSGALMAQVPEYLPLQVGNQWIYKTALGPPQVVSVVRQQTVGGNAYAVLNGFAGEVWLRQSADGVLVSYDQNARAERPYLNFAAEERRSFPSSVHPCNSSAEIGSKNFSGTFPLGDFSSVALVRYTGLTCADAGLTADYYLPYLGLLRRTETTIAGPRVYDLSYARINGTVLVATPETTFAVTTDRTAYPSGATVLARMTLRTEEELVLDFSSGQEFDYRLLDSAGEVVYQWSATRTFLAALQTLRINREKNWTATIPLTNFNGQPLPAGRYTLDGYITTTGGPRYRGMLALEILAK